MFDQVVGIILNGVFVFCALLYAVMDLCFDLRGDFLCGNFARELVVGSAVDNAIFIILLLRPNRRNKYIAFRGIVRRIYGIPLLTGDRRG